MPACRVKERLALKSKKQTKKFVEEKLNEKIVFWKLMYGCTDDFKEQLHICKLFTLWKKEEVSWNEEKKNTSTNFKIGIFLVKLLQDQGLKKQL